MKKSWGNLLLSKYNGVEGKTCTVASKTLKKFQDFYKENHKSLWQGEALKIGKLYHISQWK